MSEIFPLDYEAVIGLEVHAELLTRSKMFCPCPVVDSTQSAPNSAVCPVCSGMPGVLPVVNKQAVEYGIRVGLALGCEIAHTSIFARKNYFYPDLPKGYQISQFEEPLAERGELVISTSTGERVIRVRRVHLEEDAGKLTHVHNGESYSLVDLNRAGVPLLEIVSEPDMHTVEEARAYAVALRAILYTLGVNSGDMEKGSIRFEANVSVRPVGQTELGPRVEIKNLNSFRALERSSAYEIQRQIDLHRRGLPIDSETRGWDEARGVTFVQRSKEEAHDYRYFPEPDLPPLVVEAEQIERIRAELPELPRARMQRFQSDYALNPYDAGLQTAEPAIADYFEQAVRAAQGIAPKTVANWVGGELFSLMNQAGDAIGSIRITPAALADLLRRLDRGEVNMPTAKAVLGKMYSTGKNAEAIIREENLVQISDSEAIADLVRQTLAAHPAEISSYLAGKETLSNWFFGQVMRIAQGQANPQVVRAELLRQLEQLKKG